MASNNRQPKAIVPATEFSTNFKYGQAKPTALGGKSIGILNADNNRTVYLEMAEMKQWGIRDYNDNKSYKMSLAFPNPEYSTDAHKTIFDNIKAFEQKIKDDAVTNCKEWFGKPKMSPELVDAFFSSAIKNIKDKETGEPSDKFVMSVKVPYYDGKWMGYNDGIYDCKGDKLFPNSDPDVTPLTIIKSGAVVRTVLHCGGLWFANQQFGVTWKLDAVLLTEPLVTSQESVGCPFSIQSTTPKEKLETLVEDSDDEKGETTDVVEEEEEEEEEEKDDEEEKEEEEKEEEEEEEEVVPPPPPVDEEEVKEEVAAEVKKKVVKKVVKKKALKE